MTAITITRKAAFGVAAACGLASVLWAAPVRAQAVDLGNVTLGRSVNANGQPLAAGTYALRVTTQQAQPAATGQSPQLERWVEFVRDGQVVGREVASIVPDSDLGEVTEGARPRNTTQVQILKGNEYLRVWVNRDGNNYLLHLTIPQ